jgi:hypothetical protein
VQLRILQQQFQISQAVGIVFQNCLSRIAPLRNMMGNIDDNYARQSSHEPTVADAATHAAR